MSTFRPIFISQVRPHAGAVATYESWTRTIKIGPEDEFLYPFTLNNPEAAESQRNTLYHEIGHAFEDELDLMDPAFTAPLGHWDNERMRFVVPQPLLFRWSSPEGLYRNPSEAVAQLFADLVHHPERLTAAQQDWFSAQLAEKPEWARALAVLHVTDVPALVRAGVFTGEEDSA